jgi:hypothetical protein
VQTIENLRTRLVTEGFAWVLDGKKRQEPPTPCQLDGEAAAQWMALRLEKPPSGYKHGPLHLLADDMVRLDSVDAISDETVRMGQKKRHDKAEDGVLGESAGARRRIRGLHGRSVRNLCASP